jgi:hypothetical protein
MEQIVLNFFKSLSSTFALSAALAGPVVAPAAAAFAPAPVVSTFVPPAPAAVAFAAPQAGITQPAFTDVAALSGNITQSIGSAGPQLINLASYLSGTAGAAQVSAGPDGKEMQQDPELGFFKWMARFLGVGAKLSAPFMTSVAQGSVSQGMSNAQPTASRLPAYRM